ncbi:MAG: nucleoside deaminase [Candidatus Dadabacteria bacterium]|nr:MAG: nucleoside deaminase [Candidatus Dadabacteria bacterium]
MRGALALADEAARLGEVPVAAIVVHQGEVLGRGFNRKESGDPTAHAEMIAIREAAARIGDWRLHETTLYTTLEPCLMCAGAILQARVGRIVYGAADPKFGAVESLLRVFERPWNHRPQIDGGVLAAESAQRLRAFFAERRKTADNKA